MKTLFLHQREVVPSSYFTLLNLEKNIRINILITIQYLKHFCLIPPPPPVIFAFVLLVSQSHFQLGECLTFFSLVRHVSQLARHVSHLFQLGETCVSPFSIPGSNTEGVNAAWSQLLSVRFKKHMNVDKSMAVGEHCLVTAPHCQVQETHECGQTHGSG